MVYRAIGVWDDQIGTTIVFSEFLENAGSWSFEIKAEKSLLSDNSDLGKMINQFIDEKGLQFKVALISIYSEIAEKIINGAAIAAKTNLPVITDLSAMDFALGGSGDFFISSAAKLQLSIDQLSNLDKAICVAFMGILRWREEYNFLSSITGAKRDTIGGCVWLGVEG